MSSKPSLCPDSAVRLLCRDAGAVAVGFARCRPVDAAHYDAYRRWIDRGCHGDMAYMARNAHLRRDPGLLLPGACTVISMAFAYRPPGGYHHPLFADYALGDDYHRVIKARLASVIKALALGYGALSRVCVDSAPVLERYWAVQAGIGFIGRNRQLIVPGIGSGVFLAEIITTLYLHADSPCSLSCDDCLRCIAACPGKALSHDGSLDARRCLSYLTIEHPQGFAVPRGRRIYGCDVCAHVCPHNAVEPPEPLPELLPDPRLLALNRDSIAALSSGDFRRLFRDKAVSRVKLLKLCKNAGVNKI